MGKYEKKAAIRINLKHIVFILAVILLVLLAIVIFIQPRSEENIPKTTGSEQNTNHSRPDSSDASTGAEQDTDHGRTDNVQTSTVANDNSETIIQSKYFELSYPNAFADIISVTQSEYLSEYALEFSLNSDEKGIPLYSIWVGRKTDIVLGVLLDEKETKHPVSIEFYIAPAELADSELNTFFAAQETANEIMLQLKNLLEPYTNEEDVDSQAKPENEIKDESTSPVMDSEKFYIKENGNQIELVTKYGILSYPIAFEEIMRVTCEDAEDGCSLTFHYVADGAKIPLYTIGFDLRKGTVVGYISNAENTQSVVSIEFYDAPTDLIGTELEAFYASQETSNDVLASLEDDENYKRK